MSGLSRILIRVPRRLASMDAQNPSAIWKEVNRLGSEGKWDNINNMPKMFMFGRAKKEAYSVYNAINTKTDVWSRSPYGQIVKAIFRLTAAVCAIKACVMLYEFVVPEEHRLHYKYRNKHGHGEGHGHH